MARFTLVIFNAVTMVYSASSKHRHCLCILLFIKYVLFADLSKKGIRQV